MNLRNLSWKPLVKVVAAVAAREAGVFLCRRAINRVQTEMNPGEGKEGTERRSTGFQKGIRRKNHKGVDPVGPSPKSQAAQRRERDGNGRFTQNPKGGDTS